jgi:drug/metabolite transporter (DMT)-like permease
LLILVATIIAASTYRDGARLSQTLGSFAASGITTLAGSCLAAILFILVPNSWPESLWHSGSAFFFGHVLLFYVLSMPLWYKAIASVKGWMVSALRAVGPLAGLPLAAVLLGERLDMVQLIGGVVVILTSAAIARLQKRERAQAIESRGA